MWRYHYPEELYHYGVVGMKWGVRRYQPYPKNYSGNGKMVGQASRASFMTRHRAKKDAKEYARAKMYYGEGAGNRRKLIKAKVAERSKDPSYKAEFEKHLANQNMAKHASRAKAERHVKDAANTTAKTARGLYHLAVHDMARVSATAASIYAIARVTGADEKVKNLVQSKASDLINNVGAINKGKKKLKFRNRIDPMLDFKQTL